MKKLKKLIIATGLILSMSAFTGVTQSEAASNHKVQSGETYWKIASKYGVPVNSLMKANNASSSLLYAGSESSNPKCYYFCC